MTFKITDEDFEAARKMTEEQAIAIAWPAVMFRELENEATISIENLIRHWTDTMDVYVVKNMVSERHRHTVRRSLLDEIKFRFHILLHGEGK